MRSSKDQGMVDPELECVSLQLTNAVTDKCHSRDRGEQFLRPRNHEMVVHDVNGHGQTGMLNVKSLLMILRA
jgi:hypothetical protein